MIINNMINLNNYNEYVLNMILEQVSNDMVFQIFPRLKFLLQEIDHPIAKKILEISKDSNLTKKVTYLDYELFTNNKGKEDVRFTFTQPNKIHDYIKNIPEYIKNPEYFINGHYNSEDMNKDREKKEEKIIPRVPGKIGKIITKLFGDEFPPNGKPNEDIESFTNAIKSKLIMSFDDFKIVEGDDIVKYYNGDMYVDYADETTLGQSCMRHNKCEDYIEFYAINKEHIKLVVMFGKNADDTMSDKIAGRALLWTLNEIDGEPTDRLFMDRIYTTNDIEVDMFKAYAKDNGWLYKSVQSMHENEKIVDTINDNTEKLQMFVGDIKNNKQYPYMDTMKYYNHVEGTLTNEDHYEADIYKLESINGRYIDMGEDEDDHHDATEDMTYVEFYGEYYEDVDLTLCMNGEYRLEGDYTFLSRYNVIASNDYLESTGDFEYGDYGKEYIKSEDLMYSDYHDGFIHKDDAVKVYNNADQSYYDWRAKDDNSYFEYDGDLFDKDVDLDELKKIDDEYQLKNKHK